MANLEPKDGYTKVSNKILEALAKTRLAPNESRVILFIIRKTDGWHKEIDRISMSQIAGGTGIARQNVFRSLRSLISKNIVVRPDNKHVGFQKDYTEWIL